MVSTSDNSVIYLTSSNGEITFDAMDILPESKIVFHQASMYKVGADLDPGEYYVIDKLRAVIVREIFTRVANGDRYVEIIDDLNSRGITTKTGKPFNKNSFARMLVNERYIGVYEHSGVRVENGIPPIITRETFYRVQDRLKEGMNEMGAKRKLNSDYLLTGKLFCGECGSPMVGLSGTGRSGEIHYYYTCKNHRHDGECPKKNIRRELVEQLVLEMARACISDADVIDWLINGYKELKKAAKENSDIPLIEQELKDRKRALSNLLKAVEDGIYNATTAARMKELEQEIADMERSLSIGRMMFEETVDGERIQFYFKKLREGHPDSIQYRKEVFKTFVRCVRLWDDRIEVEFNFTGTDGDNNPYKMVKDFSGETIEESGVHPDSSQPHHHKSE